MKMLLVWNNSILALIFIVKIPISQKFWYHTMAVYIIEYFLSCQWKWQNISARLISVHCSNYNILKCFNNCINALQSFLGVSQETVYFYMFQCFAAIWNTLSKVSKLWIKEKNIWNKFSACMVIFLSCSILCELLTWWIFCNHNTSKFNFLWA